jgi:hypothetical protein
MKTPIEQEIMELEARIPKYEEQIRKIYEQEKADRKRLIVLKRQQSGQLLPDLNHVNFEN